MPVPADRLTANVAAVRARMAAAASRAARAPADVQLVAVTKSAADDAVRQLSALGLRDLAESRPQQLLRRRPLAPDAAWHLIGHLQRNKVRAVLEAAALIHSVDSLRLLERIGQLAGELGLRARVLLEVNVSGEDRKDGFAPATIRSEWRQCLAVNHVELCGLMTMAPLDADPYAARAVFRRLRELGDELRTVRSACQADGRWELSMGMSGDFEPAIEEGATLVRIGSALFEGIGEIA